MFYGQCWKCGERWELGTASACKCPDEEPVKFAFRENNDSTEVLRVTPEGEFIWHEDADRMIEEGDFSQSPALPHILKVLRKQRHEQDPVAWGVFDDNLHDMFFAKEEAQEMVRLKGDGSTVKPLYTTPPQRTWVGLTEDEAFACKGRDYFETYKAIEAKLKEKNT
jgi:hypothetical protein